jgi:hypothetical protein
LRRVATAPNTTKIARVRKFLPQKRLAPDFDPVTQKASRRA